MLDGLLRILIGLNGSDRAGERNDPAFALAVLLIEQGNAALAVPHLRKAAESPDARVRKAALDRLAGATP